MKKITIKLSLALLLTSSLFGLDRTYITPVDLSKSAIVGNIQHEISLTDDEFIQWLFYALEDRNYNAAIKIIRNLPKFERGMNTDNANNMLKLANDYLSRSSQSADKKVALVSASTGIMLNGLFYTLSKKKKNPYILDYLRVYQANEICYGYIVEANLISSYKYTRQPNYIKALRLLDEAKEICDSPETHLWESKRRNTLEVLLRERYNLIKEL